MAVNHEVVQLISEEDACVDSYAGVTRGEAGVEDSFDGCMYWELERINLEELNCTVPWLPDKSRICQGEEERERAFDLYQKNRRNQARQKEKLKLNNLLFTFEP